MPQIRTTAACQRLVFRVQHAEHLTAKLKPRRSLARAISISFDIAFRLPDGSNVGILKKFLISAYLLDRDLNDKLEKQKNWCDKRYGVRL